MISTPLFARISGTGSYLPARVVSNTELESSLDTTDAWIFERTGIRQRHLVSAGEGTASMAAASARAALLAAGLDRVDLIIVATTTPDKCFPSTACQVQAALGLPDCAAFDVAAACAGFNYALSIANQFIRTGTASSALVIGSETMSRLLNWQDRSTCILFGDGAGAVLLTASPEPGLLSCHLHADGAYQDLLSVDNSRRPNPAPLQMQGNAVFKLAVEKLGQTLSETLNANHLTVDQLDWLIPHQANVRIIRMLAKRLALPEARIVLTIEQHANTSAASVPIALDTAARDGRIQSGQYLLLDSFGGGMVWGSALVRY